MNADEDGYASPACSLHEIDPTYAGYMDRIEEARFAAELYAAEMRLAELASAGGDAATARAAARAAKRLSAFASEAAPSEATTSEAAPTSGPGDLDAAQAALARHVASGMARVARAELVDLLRARLAELSGGS